MDEFLIFFSVVAAVLARPHHAGLIVGWCSRGAPCSDEFDQIGHSIIGRSPAAETLMNFMN